MQLPARIGKYELQEFLGGGMSHVYRAVDTVIGRTVAVKILTEAGCQDAEVKERFLAEARMAGNLAHDNVLGIYDFGEDDQHRPFMVMEFLRGRDLRHAIHGNDIGDLRAKLKIALQVARALSYVHKQKVIHRDIKPENIHISSNGVVKLMDFGIAKTEGLQMTRAGYVLGTPYYMAPEQVTGQNITEQVDVYAFGILLFELLTGKKPITGDAVERIFYSILNEPLKLEPLHEAGVPEAVCDLIARCTAKNPADRPQGFEKVIADLEHAIAEPDEATMMLPAMPTPRGPAPAPVPPPAAAPVATAPSRPGWLMPAVILAIIALAAGLYFALRPSAKVVETPKKEAPAPELAARLSSTAGDMVLVREGVFLFGANKERVTLPAFYVDENEVTNGAYDRFCKETGHPLPAGFDPGRQDYPVVNVSIEDAKAFAQWAGKRLPTSQEWEKAARGTDGRLYPWGNEPDASKANIGTGKVLPAVAMRESASPCGALQMAGNVFELIDQMVSPSEAALARFAKLLKPAPDVNETWYSIRGLSYLKGEDLVPGVLYDSTMVPARWKFRDIGFRCVKDAH
jgi:eukaryotic-like serine/threonine-protein kinase